MEDQIPLTSRDEPSKTPTVSHDLDRPRGPKTAIDRLKAPLRVFGTGWRDAKYISQYIRDKHSRRFWIHVALFFVLMLALMSSGLIVLASDNSSGQYCDPGGNFDFAQTYNPWAREHTFQITLGFGRMTFTQAKAIDVVWDVVVGRGGQFLLAAICFHVFSKSLGLRLEQPKASISYGGFRAIVFERPTLSSTLKLVLDLRSTTGWRTKASVLWMITASIYVVAFPTMTSAMTGYSSNVDAYFDDGTGNGKVPIPESGYFHRAIYLVTGASRIEGLSLSDTYLVGNRGFGEPYNDPDTDYLACLVRRNFSVPSNQGDCLLAHDITQYMSLYGTESSQSTNITMQVLNNRTFSVLHPGLTIEIFNTVTKSFPDYNYYYNNDDQKQWNLTLVNQTAPFLYTTTNGSRTFNATYLNNQAGTCDSQATYLWGFSFILLFGFFAVTGVWVLGMYIMWVDTIRHSRLDRVGRTMGFYRGVADISNAMWKDTLREPGELVSDSKIRELLAQKLNGGHIAFDEINRDKLPRARIHGFRRFKHDVPSLNGWTKTWKLLHWTWFLSFAIVGLAWFYYPLVLATGNVATLRFTVVLGSIVAGVCWLVALVMVIAVTPGLKRLYHCIPRSDVLPQPRPLARWLWITVFTIFGGLSCFVTIAFAKLYLVESTMSYYYYDENESLLQACAIVLMIYAGIAGLFWTVAATMLLVGLFSTLWRWSMQLVRLVLRPWQRHKAIPLAQEDTSYRNRSIDDNESNELEMTTPAISKTFIGRDFQMDAGQ